LPPSRIERLTGRVERWFDRHQRDLPWRRTYDAYHVWISEVMLQQTRMEVVLEYYERFLQRFPTIAALAAATDDEVLSAWSGLGYYRRARMLRDAAGEVVRRFAGRVPDTVEELRALPGIGRYTAGAIVSIAHDRRAPIVDGNIARIVARLEGVEEPIGSPALMRAAWRHAEEMVQASASPRTFNQGLMEIGALICRPRKPLCGECPLHSDCRAFALDATERIPLPKERVETRRLNVPLYLVTDSAGRLLMRRETGQLMTSMFHLPHGESSLLSGRPLETGKRELIGAFRHTITTRRIVFTVYAAELAGLIAESPDQYTWIAPDEISTLPHPSYVRKALRLAAAKSAP
jgi:A/G-specific adenine glycosylase